MPESVPATLQYLANNPKYDTEKPYQVLINLSHVPGSRKSNHEYETVKDVPITDVRTCDELPTLDEHGFQLEKLPNMLYPTDFDNDEWVTSEYYAYIQSFLKNLLQAKEVIIFEHQLRYRHPGFGIGEAAHPHLAPAESYAPPVPVVHSDQSKRAARARFHRHWPNFTEDMWKDRWQTINVWVPLNEVVEEWPVAFCDCRTVDPKDIRASDLVRQNYHGESVLSTRNPNHRWYYANKQKYGEAWVFKLYDSDPNAASSKLIKPVAHVASTEKFELCCTRPLIQVQAQLAAEAVRSEPLYTVDRRE